MINAADITYWPCNECGQTFHIFVDIQKMGETKIPDHPKEYNPETVRFKCEKCGYMNSHGSLKYLNRLPATGKWRCAKCGMVYIIKTIVAKGGKIEASL
jgi:ribosomal protein S27AE